MGSTFLSFPRKLRRLIYHFYATDRNKSPLKIQYPLRKALYEFKEYDAKPLEVREDLAFEEEWIKKLDHALAFTCMQILQENIAEWERAGSIVHSLHFTGPLVLAYGHEMEVLHP
jgi:hypothetical protein